MSLRTLLFWPHLVAGILSGAVILLMSVTGVLLTYERQMIAWSDRDYRDYRSVPPSVDAPRAALATVAAGFQARYPDLNPETITVPAEPDAPIAITANRRTFYADAYSGATLGEASQGMRQAMSDLRAWHRWLAVEGEGRPVARAITGWANLLFAFLVASGIYLWCPRTWGWTQVRAVLLFRSGLRGKARDFNWHNVLGFWSAVPLFIVVVSAVPISFPWANAAIYQALGEPVPAGRGGGPGAARGGGPGAVRGGGPGAARGDASGVRAGRGEAAGETRGDAGATRGTPDDSADRHVLTGVDALLARATSQEAGWRTIGVRVPASADAPVTFSIDRGDGGQPHLRSTLTLARNGAVEQYEDFESLTPGRRIRSTMRFAHTGEALGIAGQTVAGLVSLGSVVLVWTGIALAWRRLRAWITRRRRGASAAVPAAQPLS